MSQKPKKAVRKRPVNLVIWLGIVVFAFLLYGNTIKNSYSLDDSYVTVNNPRVQKGFAGIPEVFTSRYVDEEGNSFGYRPVAMATFAIEFGFWGQNPHMSHFINVVIYALILLILFNILHKVFKSTNILFILAVVLLFAAHPIHTEVVASLKNREALLSLMFSLGALSCILKWMDLRRIWLIIAAALFFILAFLSKQDAITFVAVIPLALFFYSDDPLSSWVTLPPKLKTGYGLKILSLISFVFFCFAAKRIGLWASVSAYFSTLALLIIYYVYNIPKEKIAEAKRVILIFPLAGTLSLLMGAIVPSWHLALLSLAFYAVFFLRIFENSTIKNILLSKKFLIIAIPMLVVGIAGILAYKLPNLYLPDENKLLYHFENPQVVNDPLYSMFPTALYTLFFYLNKLVWPSPLGFYYGYKMIPEVSWTSPYVIFSLVFYAGIFIFALIRLRQKHILSFAILFYLFTISIFTNIIIKIPGIVGERLAFFPSLGFCMVLAWMIFRVLKIDIQLPQIQRIKVTQLSLILMCILVPYSIKTVVRNTQWKDYLTLFSHDIGYLDNSAKANNVYAAQLLKEAFNNDVKNPAPDIQQEYLTLAVKHLKKTVEIDPTYKFAWNNLGFLTYRYLDKKEEGIDYMNKAVQLDPGYAEAQFNLGYAYKQKGNFEQSIQHFHEAQRINPNKILYFTEEADACFQSGKPEKALLLYNKASGLDSTSDQPLIGMGNIYFLSGDTVRAIENWEKAFKINPINLEICNNLLGYYTSKGNPKAAYYKIKVRELMQKSP